MSQAGFPYAYPPEGSVQVAGDGPELLVYSGVNDAPMWKQFTDGLIVGVGATRDRVFTVDADGRLTSWRGIDGTKLDEAEVPMPGARALVNTSDGLCGVLVKDGVFVGEPRGGGQALAVPGASAVGFGATRTSLGIGTSKGKFQVFDPTTGQALGGCDVGGPVHAVAWRAQGQWVVAAGQQVHLVAADGSAVGVSIPIGAMVSLVACSYDGALIVAVAGGTTLLVIETATNQTIGRIVYQRQVNGIAFGPQGWLGIGLDDGDTNRVDLLTGHMCRNEPQAGRSANRWAFNVEVDPLRIRQAVTSIRAGGGPIATHIKPPDPEEEKAKKKSNGCLYTCLFVVLAAIVCSGCSGITAILYFTVYAPR
jgi:hypothetical protein